MEGKFCPLIRKNCVEHKCSWYTHLMGKDPQTGNDTDKWGCAIQFTPLLLIESASQTRGATASIDKLRDEHDKATRAQCSIMAAIVEHQQIEPVETKILPN